jgi:ATP-binding cassette subfamily F protein 3
MLSISNASFGYEIEDAAPKTILRGVSRSVLAGQRIGILGANGQGKSTLVKTIAREMGALAGEVTEGKGLNIGYFAQQELDVLRPQDNPLEHMVRMARELGSNAKEATGEQALRGFLGSFNFSGDMVKQPVGTMSGGEKARLVLAMMVWQRPNLLLLDEPTNHLDLATREALAVALNEFEGTLMLVSHDRALLAFGVRRVLARGPRCRHRLRRRPRRLPALPAGRSQAPARRSQGGGARCGAIETAAAVAAKAPTATAAASATEAANKNPAAQADAQPPAAQRPGQADQARNRPDRRAPGRGRHRTHRAGGTLAEPLPPAEIADAGKRLKALNDEIGRLEERWLALVGPTGGIGRLRRTQQKPQQQPSRRYAACRPRSNWPTATKSSSRRSTAAAA